MRPSFEIFKRLLFVFVGICVAQHASAQGFSKLVVFGDSLSDTGNLASVSVNFPFPFFENRISNGPVLVDYLGSQISSNAEASQHLGGNASGFNYAVAGGNIIGTDREDLGPQISAYLERAQNQADSQALYFILMGGNDLRDIRSIKSLELANLRIAEVLGSLDTQIRRLVEAGATTFMLPNMPNIGRLPQTLAREATDQGVVARARQYSVIYNQQLLALIAELRSELNIGITEFDLFSELERLFVSPERFGFTQTTVGCFEFDGFRFQPECLFGTRFDRFVFFDSIHPSARTNELIALQLAKVVPAGVFVPQQKVIVSPILQLLLE